ncbi:MAG TPA: hypothetical protein PLA50_03410 [Bacteroidia bacterium]|nr:hypothetical protein [Bacteroidia bacterium]
MTIDQAPPARELVIAAVHRLDAASKCTDIYPPLPFTHRRVLRHLAETSISEPFAYTSSREIGEALDLSAESIQTALVSLPGLLALYAPGTVRIIRKRISRARGVRYAYRLAA